MAHTYVPNTIRTQVQTSVRAPTRATRGARPERGALRCLLCTVRDVAPGGRIRAGVHAGGDGGGGGGGGRQAATKN